VSLNVLLNSRVDVLSSRILVWPSDVGRSRRFCRDVLGLAIYWEFGPPDDPGAVFFLGAGLLEVSGHTVGPAGHSVMIWIQVRDVRAEHARLAAAGIPIIRGPATEPWGLTECGSRTPTASKSSWSRLPPITLSAVTCDRRHRQDDELLCGRSGCSLCSAACMVMRHPAESHGRRNLDRRMPRRTLSAYA
jgi:hypothetical protein